MNTEPPFEGDVPGDGNELPYSWLDEWLCEYVDGTMDPSLEAVFEQYVEANPELKAHVERLRETRDLLCRCAPPEEPSSDVEAEVCREVECDMLQSPAPVAGALQDRPIAALGLVSSIAVALVIGFLIGTMAGAPSPTSETAHRMERTASPPPSMQFPQATASDPSHVLLYRSTDPFSVADSTHRRSSFTTIGAP